LDEKIKRKLKLSNFNNVFQIIKIIEFEIRSKNKEIKIPRNSSLFKMKKGLGSPWPTTDQD